MTAGTLPPYPLLWLNEVQPYNLTGITNRAGQHAPWIELFNSGTNAISVSEFFLSDNFNNLVKWQFPPGSVINAGQFVLVWADGQSGQTTATEWHTSFRLPATNGVLALSRLLNGQPQIMDYLRYLGIASDQSYGCYSDAPSAARAIFLDLTPGRSTNVPPRASINEWMG